MCVEYDVFTLVAWQTGLITAFSSLRHCDDEGAKSYVLHYCKTQNLLAAMHHKIDSVASVEFGVYEVHGCVRFLCLHH